MKSNGNSIFVHEISDNKKQSNDENKQDKEIKICYFKQDCNNTDFFNRKFKTTKNFIINNEKTDPKIVNNNIIQIKYITFADIFSKRRKNICPCNTDPKFVFICKSTSKYA